MGRFIWQFHTKTIYIKLIFIDGHTHCMNLKTTENLFKLLHILTIFLVRREYFVKSDVCVCVCVRVCGFRCMGCVSFNVCQ